MDAGRFFTIVNGAAGGGRCRSHADLALAQVRQEGFELDIHFTEAPGHASELAAEAWDEGYRRFLSVGGDGTSYEVINGLLPRCGEHRPVVGILPLGTGNSFLRDFEIDEPEAALEAIRRGRLRRCDVVRVEHRDGVLYYMNILGLGFTAQAGALTNERFKPLGTAGYVLAVLLRTIKLQHPVDRIRFDGADEVDARPATLLSFCNSRYTGGAMMMAPEADCADGRVDVIRVGAMPRRRFVAMFPRIFSGAHVALPEVEQRRAHRVEFDEPREQPAMIDGEIRRLAIRTLQVLPGALEVYA